MRSCCHGCPRELADKNDWRCVKCPKRLALLDRLDYLAQNRSRDGEAYAVSGGVIRYHGQPEIWAG